MRNTLLLSATVAACAAACATATPIVQSPDEPTSESAQAAGGLVEYVTRPQKLDPAADKYQEGQYAYRMGEPPKSDKLVVYLVGANGKPIGSRPMLQLLARLGFRVICPMYATDYNIVKLCSGEGAADENCHKKARLEAFEGIDHSPHIDISRANSAEERIARFIIDLSKSDPDGGWGGFLDGTKPKWSQIIIAGHSHGASSAGLIGKVRTVNRVVMLSGPYDNRDNQPAPWIAMDSVTPVDRYYGFSHSSEEQNVGHLKNWEAMKLSTGGAVTSVDDTKPPFNNSHQLVTNLPVESKANAHGTTTAGRTVLRNPDGSYRFEPVWRYLFGLPQP